MTVFTFLSGDNPLYEDCMWMFYALYYLSPQSYDILSLSFAQNEKLILMDFVHPIVYLFLTSVWDNHVLTIGKHIVDVELGVGYTLSPFKAYICELVAFPVCSETMDHDGKSEVIKSQLLEKLFLCWFMDIDMWWISEFFYNMYVICI